MLGQLATIWTLKWKPARVTRHSTFVAQYVLRHQAALTGLLAADLITMAQKRTLSHFDTSVMVKIFGYRDLQHYYTRVLLPPSRKLLSVPCRSVCRPHRVQPAISLSRLNRTRRRYRHAFPDPALASPVVSAIEAATHSWCWAHVQTAAASTTSRASGRRRCGWSPATTRSWRWCPWRSVLRIPTSRWWRPAEAGTSRTCKVRLSMAHSRPLSNEPDD